jgi:hypothetical protein
MVSYAIPLPRQRACVLLAALVAATLSVTAVVGADEPEATVLPSAVATDAMETFPLPDIVGDPSDLPTVSLDPESEPGWTVGETRPFEFGHCGILSPVDVDGSLWQPVAGTDGQGGPIGDEGSGELVNATPGELTLTTLHTADFVSASGLSVQFMRAPGALDYFLCM